MPVANAKKTPTRDKERMNFRLDPEIKARVVRAAAITGQDLTDFAVSAINEKANEVLERHDTITLDSREYNFFLGALEDNSKAPSRRSRAAARRYRRGRRKGVRYHLDN